LLEQSLRVELIHATTVDVPPPACIAQISCADQHAIVRITGGCANMAEADAAAMGELFRKAFRGFGGALLIGGTRMVSIASPRIIIPGITEVGPLIRQDNPSSVLLGIIPFAESVSWDFATGALVVERSRLTDPHGTDDGMRILVQSYMDGVVVLGQHLPDLPSIWHDEAYFCARITEPLRRHANWSSALVVYNGGNTTEYEARLIAEQHWPVILVRGSGRAADKLAQDEQFLREYRDCVTVCSLTPSSLKRALVKAKVLEPKPRQRRSQRTQKGGVHLMIG